MLLTNYCHETIYQIYAGSVSLTHWHQNHQILPPTIWWQPTCASLSCLLATWSMTNIVFMWVHWSVTYLLMIMNHLQGFIIPYEGHLPPSPPIVIWTFLCWCAVWHKCIPRNVEILKKLWEWHHPIPNIYILGHGWTLSTLVSDNQMWPSLKCRLNTEFKIIHLCWNK